MESRLNELVTSAFNETFHVILSFLGTTSVTNFLKTSKQCFHLANKFFQLSLVTKGLMSEVNPQIPIEDYYKVFRLFYCRPVMAAPITYQNNPVAPSDEQFIFSRYSRYSNFGAKYFSMGVQWTAFHLFNDDMVYIKTEDYLNPGYDIKVLQRKNTRHNVKKFYTTSKHLIYLTNSGQISIIFYEKDKPLTELAEATLEITKKISVRNCWVTYMNALMLFDAPKYEKSEKAENNNEEEKINLNLATQDSGIRVFGLNEITALDLNNPLRLCEVLGIHQSDVLDACIGNTLAYLVDIKGLIYECDLAAPKNNKFMALMYEPLKTKQIKRVYAGNNYYFAIQRDELDSIEKWSNEQVLEWAEKIKFTDYLKILKHENVTGNTLFNVDRQYLIRTLGINKEDLITKFLTEISKVSKVTYGKSAIYGWGNNAWGQLGVYTGTAIVNHPVKIKTPNWEKEDDEVMRIECGFKQSAILTKNKNLWITNPYMKPSAKDNDEKKPPKEEKAGSRKGSTKNDDKYEKQHKKSKSEQEEESSHRWIEISDMARSTKDKHEYQIIAVAFSKDKIAILDGYLGRNVEKNKAFMKLLTNLKPGHSQKLKDAAKIIDRIKWDKSQNQEDFTVGYDDRFLGIMYIPFVEFTQKEDIPMHRIQSFKRKGVTVWDRSNKTYNF